MRFKTKVVTVWMIQIPIRIRDGLRTYPCPQPFAKTLFQNLTNHLGIQFTSWLNNSNSKRIGRFLDGVIPIFEAAKLIQF